MDIEWVDKEYMYVHGIKQKDIDDIKYVLYNTITIYYITN